MNETDRTAGVARADADLGGEDTAEGCYAAGREALRRGNVEDARLWAARCDAVASDDARCNALHGAVALEEGDFDDAIVHLQRAAQLAPGDVAIARQLGEALVAGGVMGEAVDVLAEAARRAPDDVDLLVDHAYARMMNGDEAGARETVERAAALQPDSTAVLIAQARIYEALGQPDLAVTTLHALTNAVADPRTLTDLARLNLQQGRYGEADSVFRRLAAIDPEHSLVSAHGRIWCQIKRGDWRSALALSLEATRIDRYDLTTALLAYARDRLFTQLPAAAVAARETELGDRVMTALQEHAELHADEALVAAVGTGQEGDRG